MTDEEVDRLTDQESNLEGEAREQLKKKYDKDCERCGPAVEEKELCLLAWDVEALSLIHI